MSVSGDKKWEDFYLEGSVSSYPRWPLEAMVKTVFGGYLRERIVLPDRAKVLDVGCGVGNNLLPFLDRGHEGYGTEVTEAIAAAGERQLADRGFRATIRQGRNRHIPFDSGQFDLLLSLNVLHYERDEPGIVAALEEYARVLAPGGALVVFTVGPRHEIYTKAERLGGHRYRIANYDFRDGEEYFYFDDGTYVEQYLRRRFERIELGRVTEELYTTTLDFLTAVARRRA